MDWVYVKEGPMKIRIGKIFYLTVEFEVFSGKVGEYLALVFFPGMLRIPVNPGL